MSEFADATSALLAQVSKLVRTLSDDELKRLCNGELKLALIGPAQRVIEKSPALDRALKVVGDLADDDVRRLEDRQASLVLLRKGDKVVSAFDPREVAAQVLAQASEAEVIRLLASDARLTAANLKKVADALDIPVPADIKAKTALQLFIAERAASGSGARA